MSTIIPYGVEFRVLLEERGRQIKCGFGQVIVGSLKVSGGD